MGQISIDDLRIKTIIGTLPAERITPQELIISLIFDYDAGEAAASDDLTLSVDYSAVERQVVQAVSESSYFLVEALAKRIAGEVLSFAAVDRVKVVITKPGASAFGAMISYSEEFSRQER